MKTQKLCAEVQINERDYETDGIAETIETISKKTNAWLILNIDRLKSFRLFVYSVCFVIYYFPAIVLSSPQLPLSELIQSRIRSMPSSWIVLRPISGIISLGFVESMR